MTQHTPTPQIWAAFYIVIFTLLISLQWLWVPQQLTLTIYDERLKPITYYENILYSKIYNHSINGQFRLIDNRHHIRMPAASSFNLVSIRAWFDEETDRASLIMNERSYNISSLNTYAARRYHLLTHADQLVNFRFVTKNQPFFSFDKAIIQSSAISRTHSTIVFFYLAVALQLFIFIYAVWPFHITYNGILGALTATITTSALIAWLSITNPIPMLFLVIHALPAAIILLLISISLIWASPRITAYISHITTATTHIKKYWDGYILVLMHVSIYVISMIYQSVISRGRNSYGFDGAIYYTMTEQLIANQTVTHVAPLVSRIGIPWLVAQLFGTNPLAGWQLITTVCGLICTIMLYALSREIITHPLIRIITVTLFMTHWLAPLRYSWFHPVTLDAPLTALILVAVWTSMQYQKSWQPRWLVFFAVNLIIGVTIREVSLLFIGFLVLAEQQLIRHPIAMLKQPAVRQRLIAYAGLATIAIGLYWTIQQSVVPTNNHSAITQAIRQITYKQTYYWVLQAWFNTNGLLIIWLIIGYRSWLSFLLKYRQIAFISIMIIALTFISGTDKDRFLMWMHPFLLLMAAYCFEANFKLFNTAWSTLIVYVQLIIGRAFWQTPDPGQPSRMIDTTFLTHLGDNIFFLELWSHHAQDMYHKALTIQQFLWALLIMLIIFGVRAWRLRQTQLMHATESSY